LSKKQNTFEHQILGLTAGDFCYIKLDVHCEHQKKFYGGGSHMSEEKVGYRIVTENNVVIEVEPKAEQTEMEKRLKEIAALLSAKKKKEE
jgi:hypothetical protein